MSKSKKILYIVTKARWGGTQRHIYDIATALPKNEYECIVALGKEGELESKLKDAGITTVSIPELKRDIAIIKDFRSFLAIRTLIKKENPDILHLHSSKAGGLGALAGRMCGVKKIIFTVHGWPFKEDRTFWQYLAILLFSWITVLLTHITIVVSGDDYSKIISLPMTRKKVRIIRNGVKKFNLLERMEARQAITKKPEESETTWIGTIAELHKNKGLEYALQAVSELSKKDNGSSSGSSNGSFCNFKYVIIGDGEEKENLMSLVSALGIEERVFFAGHIPDGSSYLKAFDIFLLPSIKEGLPYALLEAGTAELPTIATNVGGIPEIITDMESGIIIRSKSSRELKEAMRFMIGYKERGRFGKALGQKISSDFNLKSMIEKTKEIYDAT